MGMLMTIGEILYEAVEAESWAAQFYGRLASCTQDLRTRRLFLDMVKVEQRRRAEIRQLAGSRLCGVTINHGDRSYEWIKVAPGWTELLDITYGEALQIILECQRRAAEYYAGLQTLFEGEEARLISEIWRVEEQMAGMVEDALRQYANRSAHRIAA